LRPHTKMVKQSTGYEMVPVEEMADFAPSSTHVASVHPQWRVPFAKAARVGYGFMLAAIAVCLVMRSGSVSHEPLLRVDTLERLVGLEEKKCGTPTNSCLESKCCLDKGLTCFRKNDQWANCNITCKIGISHMDPEKYRTPWSCDILGPTNGDSSSPGSGCWTEGPRAFQTNNPIASTYCNGNKVAAKVTWECLSVKCQAPHPSLCNSCTGKDGEKGFWSQTKWCCPDMYGTAY